MKTFLQNRIFLLKTEIYTRSKPTACFPFKENEKEIKEKELKDLETKLKTIKE